MCEFTLLKNEIFIWVLCRLISTETEWGWENIFKFHHN